MNWKALLKTLAVGAAGGAIGAGGEFLKPSGVDVTPALPAIVGLIALLIKNPWQKSAPPTATKK
jgi:hypothetical protein